MKAYTHDLLHLIFYYITWLYCTQIGNYLCATVGGLPIGIYILKFPN